ncbi:GGDEF domain-containing protein [Amycolatopsis pigmentata]|uniref:Diguanylate cyclase n=1 Tax=Amycolatopsis pigmentata TaxID=450801 RepID=A0ABW5FRP9_9PSEU
MFVLGVEIAAVVVTAIFAVVRPPDERDVVLFGVIVGLGLVAAEATRHVERMRRRFADTPHVNMSSVWTLAAAVVTTPLLATVTAGVLYLHLWLRSWRRVQVAAYRTVFNASAVSLSCCAAAALTTVLPAYPLSLDRPVSLLGLLGVLVGYWSVNSGLVAAAIALTQEDHSLRRLLGTWSENSLEGATLCVGALTAVLLEGHSWAVAFVLPPLFVLTRAVLIRQLEHAATTDGKTGLLNAASWYSLANAELARAVGTGGTTAVLMIDLDHFKRINDTFSHEFGDEVLRAVADELSRGVRRYDLCGRFGGEEFVVLLPETSVEQATQVAERICAAVRGVSVCDPSTGRTVDGLRLTVSIGAALYPDHGHDLHEVLMAADNAMFLAKDSGRDCVRAVQSDGKTPLRN